MNIKLPQIIISFILCISLCIFSSFYIQKSMQHIYDEIENIENSIDKMKSADIYIRAGKLKTYMHEKEKILEMLVPHEDLHDLGMQIADVVLSLKIDDLDDSRKAIALVKENALHLIKHESFSLSNIF